MSLLDWPFPSFTLAVAQQSTCGLTSLLESGRGHQTVEDSGCFSIKFWGLRCLSDNMDHACPSPRCPPACITQASSLLCHLHSTRGDGVVNYAPACCLWPVLFPIPCPTSFLTMPGSPYYLLLFFCNLK